MPQIKYIIHNYDDINYNLLTFELVVALLLPVNKQCHAVRRKLCTCNFMYCCTVISFVDSVTNMMLLILLYYGNKLLSL